MTQLFISSSVTIEMIPQQTMKISNKPLNENTLFLEGVVIDKNNWLRNGVCETFLTFYSLFFLVCSLCNRLILTKNLSFKDKQQSVRMREKCF